MSTFYLFAMPTFWSGVARVVDLAGRFDDYNFSVDEAEADAVATWTDWIAVGDDLAVAAESVRERQLTR